MPNRDGTGPDGQGPKTGQALGPCDKSELPCPRQGRGRAMRRGGRGMLGRFFGRGRNRQDQE
ncbi:DUF5320 domain-containing protein [Candidatus Uhrbacteria bacterium]|nr:DUF5320 domain-containing protein [Candidatus Uhrbacteria bacterium]MBT7717141.1 DUF5320 domain-containing protein [Candidatus Uhrbacteria bacterium]